MVAKILDGKELAGERYELLRARVADMDHVPALAVVLVGDDYASHLYVKLKEKAAKKVGIDFHKYLFEVDTPEDLLCESISFLRADVDVDGILVQLPLPAHFDTGRVIAAMGSEKDVDGFHPDNITRFIEGDSDAVHPVFPQALIDLAEASNENLENKKAVIIGKSDVFTGGMIAAVERLGVSITRIECDGEFAENEDMRGADIVFTACGTPGMLRGEHIKDGVIVVDGGISDVNGESVGDVDFESVAGKASHITPVPGGVGPMTIACLLENVVALAQKNQK